MRDALVNVEHPVSILGWLRKSASARLLAQLAAKGEPITHQMLDGLPQSRNLHYVRQVLVHTGVLPDRVEYLERIGPWLDHVLLDVPTHHGQLVRPFAHWFVLRRARRASLRRSYTQGAGASARRRIRAALDFLQWADERNISLGELKQAQVEQWLNDGPKTRYDIRSFLAWTANRKVTPPLTVPARSFRQYFDQVLEEDQHLLQLRRCVTDTTLPVDVRAAGALVSLFGIPVSRIVELTSDRLITQGENSYLVIGRHPVLLPPSVAELLQLGAQSQPRSALGRAVPGRRWLFPGLNPGRHITANRITERLRHFGIEARTTRSTALCALAADMPAAILADLLGIHIATAAYWVSYVKRDWADYVAARAVDTGRPGRLPMLET
ncbi:MAG TPA: hypothetical protein VGZ32_06390 [Actinocrinis sp.]|uniref:hypothetical protein n=1 Tax=Actinocrinis sp. TaxID=1920516 RepID=UPI002DDD4E6D|nr:hypothetical protein [Actinocrinis sp.]HEV3169947.1 hypothetical protein [Actinocrinis sp.]